MATRERVTVTLRTDLLERIDRLERNRSRFIAQAVEHDLARRRRDELARSLRNPHVEAADVGLEDWAATLPPEDEELLDSDAGTPVRWVEGEGWVEEPG
jgi:hypothetical protein